MNCAFCIGAFGVARPMYITPEGVAVCEVCKTTKPAAGLAPVLLVRSGISSALYIGGFLLLLLASVVFDAFPELQVPLTWTMLYSLYLVYFGLAFANFKRAVYVR